MKIKAYLLRMVPFVVEISLADCWTSWTREWVAQSKVWVSNIVYVFVT